MNEATETTQQIILADGTPDWEAISFDVLCSRCGYNLRTLTRPRCTECGLEFEWYRLLDQAARRSDFLFEHHWPSRPFHSWLTTVWRSLRPKAFWGRVSLHDDVRTVPLIAHLFLAIITAFVMLHESAWILSRAIRFILGIIKSVPKGSYRPGIRERFFNMAFRLHDLASQPFTEGWDSIIWKTLAVATPFAGALVLLFALRQTMRRYRVRLIQLFRVIAYTAAPVCFWSTAAYLVGLFILPSLLRVAHFRLTMRLVLAIFVWSVLSWYLGRGFKHYLHLPHSALLSMTAALVGILTLVTVNLVTAAIQERLWW